MLCVPEKYISIILYQYHTPLLAGHPCVMTMYHMVRKKYYFPTMLPLIKQFVTSCYECTRYERKATYNKGVLSKNFTRIQD